MKLYINAGADTYEFAELFSNTCKQQIGIDPKTKVAIGNMLSEINRGDKLCIYTESIEQSKQYIEILEKIKKERPNFKFEEPMLTAGSIDNWIGIGSDIKSNSSYNKDVCDILINSFNKYFGNMSRQEIIEQVSKNPHVLDKIRNNITEECLRNGRSPEKLCIREDDIQVMKQMKFDISDENEYKQKQAKSIDQIISKEVRPEDISEDLMKKLSENGYDGKTGHPVLQNYYKLYCKNQDEERRKNIDGKKIENLEEKIEIQNDKIFALKSRKKVLESIMRKQESKVSEIKGVLSLMSAKAKNVKETQSDKGILGHIKGIFSKKQDLLPENSYESIRNNADFVDEECARIEDSIKQNMPSSVEEIAKNRQDVRENEKKVKKLQKGSDLLFPEFK